MSISLLVVDHSAQQRELMTRRFEERGISVRTATSASEARIAHSEHAPDVAIVSLPLSEGFQNSLPSLLLDADPHLAMVILVESGASADVADEVHNGAICLERPVKLEGLVEVVERAARLRRMREELALRRRERHTPAPLPSGIDVLIDLAARNPDAPVLIVGEPGTGKSMVARLVHDLSEKSGAPFLPFAYSPDEESSFERVLFGCERGASPDSQEATIGLLDMADTGTVLLRMIASVPYDSQSHLLRFVEDGTFTRVGGSVRLRSGARIMATSTRPLAAEVESGEFRSELFYRLQVLTISLPPLRERIDDLERLVAALLPAEIRLSPTALLALQEHSWPGNVRELENVLWRASLLAKVGVVELRHLALTAGLAPLGTEDEAGRPGRQTPIKLAEVERRTILAALERTGGNKLRAAALLGIARSTLHDKLRRL